VLPNYQGADRRVDRASLASVHLRATRRDLPAVSLAFSSPQPLRPSTPAWGRPAASGPPPPEAPRPPAPRKAQGAPHNAIPSVATSRRIPGREAEEMRHLFKTRVQPDAIASICFREQPHRRCGCGRAERPYASAKSPLARSTTHAESPPAYPHGSACRCQSIPGRGSSGGRSPVSFSPPKGARTRKGERKTSSVYGCARPRAEDARLVARAEEMRPASAGERAP